MMEIEFTREEVEKAIRDNLAEAVHTSWRKGVDGPPSGEIWQLISKMDRADWKGYLDYLAWGHSYSVTDELNKLLAEKQKKES